MNHTSGRYFKDTIEEARPVVKTRAGLLLRLPPRQGLMLCHVYISAERDVDKAGTKLLTTSRRANTKIFYDLSGVGVLGQIRLMLHNTRDLS